MLEGYDRWRLAAPADYPSEAEAWDLPVEVDDYLDDLDLGAGIVSVDRSDGRVVVEVDTGDNLSPWDRGPVIDVEVLPDGTVVPLECCDRCDRLTPNYSLCDDCLADQADSLEYRGEK